MKDVKELNRLADIIEALESDLIVFGSGRDSDYYAMESAYTRAETAFEGAVGDFFSRIGNKLKAFGKWIAEFFRALFEKIGELINRIFAKFKGNKTIYVSNTAYKLYKEMNTNITVLAGVFTEINKAVSTGINDTIAEINSDTADAAIKELIEKLEKIQKSVTNDRKEFASKLKDAKKYEIYKADGFISEANTLKVTSLTAKKNSENLLSTMTSASKKLGAIKAKDASGEEKKKISDSVTSMNKGYAALRKSLSFFGSIINTYMYMTYALVASGEVKKEKAKKAKESATGNGSYSGYYNEILFESNIDEDDVDFDSFEEDEVETDDDFDFEF